MADRRLDDAPILMTGFPGFLSGHLVDALADRGDAPLHFLCLDGTVDAARARLERLQQDHPGLGDRCHIHTGDLTKPNLGLDPQTYDELTDEIEIVWHLAAIYDLSVAQRVAYRVNVGGTVKLLDFCEQCQNFRRLNYVSTCFVAGQRTGTVYEGELDVGQHHKNHYESTKFWAEVEVQRRRDEIPTTIFRPSIVVGDSNTGATTKYDGPYYIFQLLHRLPEWMPVPAVGDGDAPVNLVPVDFVTEAMAQLGGDPETDGEVFQLADPSPMDARTIVDRTLEQMGHRRTVGRLPARWVERALNNETVEEWTGVPRQALTYFNHRVDFDTIATDRALADTGIKCPPLSAYLGDLVDFFLRHPDQPPETV